MRATARQAAVLAGFALLMVMQVLARPLLPIDETRYLAVAWEMHLSGDIFHLTRNFDLYSHKPPLLFWLVNLVWLVTGVSEFWGRMVGPACAVLTLAATARLARQIWPQEPGIGLRAMLILGSFLLFAVYGSATMFDALLALIVVVGMGILWRIGQGAALRRDWLLFGLALGLGVLAKGPVVLLHLLPVALSMPLWAPAPPPMRALLRGIGTGLLAGLGLACLWLLPALLSGGAAYRTDLLWTQSASRINGTLGHGRPFWFLLALIPVILFPWGWTWRFWRGLPGQVRRDAGQRLCAIWAGAAVILFSAVGGKQVHYLLPELPAMALLMARGGAAADLARRGGSLAFLLPVVLGAALLAIVAGLLPAGGATADLSPGWVVALAALGLLALGAAALRLPQFRAHLLLGFGTSALLHLLIAATGLGAGHDTTPIAQRLAARQDAGMAVVGMPYNADFNFAGRLTRPVDTPADPKAWAIAHPGGILVGPVATSGITAAPQTLWRYRGEDFGAWDAASLHAASLPAATLPAAAVPSPAATAQP